MKKIPFILLALSFLCCFACGPRDKGPRRLEILFLGHENKHHDSEKATEILSQELFKDGINITYTTNPDDLNEKTLSQYDGLVLYANYDSITPSQAKALLQFVKNGKGFIPVHCASYCFRNSPEAVDLIGGQFKSHQWDSFPAHIVKPEHPVMKGVPAFWTEDETYVHDKISKQIEVLMERVEGDHKEPYTWVRSYGEGRVFYTAYGHDEHTWRNPGFLQLMKNGILWAVGDKARAMLDSLHLPQPKYVDANIPNYEHRNPPPQLQEPLTPQQSMLLSQFPPGFKMELFAAEPDIINPIYMNWDERGRLWVIETVDYPNTVREDKSQGDDRIKILEDTDGDGRADKSTIFADKLNIPTSFAFANGGIIVAQAPYFLYLKDTNGDDKADVKDTLITGWGTFDTHAGPSNLRYGLDNHIWGTVGYSGFQGTVGKDTLHFGQGLYRLTTNGKQLEYLSPTSNNTWGLGFTEDFDVFISTANNNHSGFFGMAKRYLDKAGINEPGVEKIDAHYAMHAVTKHLRQVDVQGGFTAAAGHSFYTARSFPPEYWNKVAFVCEPTGRVIHKQVITPDGAGFKEKGDGWNFLASADEWFGPVQAEVGPDGALWVLDWYDFIIQHNPIPEGFQNGAGNAYVNPWRDTSRGRIYRISYEDAPKTPALQLRKNDPQALVKALSNDNMFWRTTAQRLLVESGNKAVLPELYKLVRNEQLDGAGINAPAIHALWTMHGLGALDGSNKEALEVAVKALHHPAAGVRRAAIQVLPPTQATAAALLAAKVDKDPDLRVRLAFTLAATELPASKAVGQALFDMAEQKENAADKWLKQGLTIAADMQQEGFMAALKNKGTSETPVTEDLGKPDQVVVIKPIQNAMKYDKTSITVKAGTVVEIRFENVDFMQHNLLILQPGSLEKVGAKADALAQDPQGSSRNYVPKMPEVLYATPLVDPEGKYSLKFRVPATAGDYPYACSYPGHWRMMNGIMKVVK